MESKKNDYMEIIELRSGNMDVAVLNGKLNEFLADLNNKQRENYGTQVTSRNRSCRYFPRARN